ncbi:MAG: hypothetical protein GX495_19300 [Chloroflexi bacterium]|jgi:NTE family protein|nr:hypothetical protein [Chloroflexota bacterium]
MKKCLAFVLGGGGARGAMQVGAMRALLEAGIKPDLLIGTSIGAVNATGLAVFGLNLEGIRKLESVYQEVADMNLMDPRVSRLTLRALFGRPNHHASRRVMDFLVSKGITGDLKFEHIPGVRLALVSADLASGEPVIYGQNPGDSVLEGLMASMALHPWFAPLVKDGHLIVDGGALSNLPIEPAMSLGATEIISMPLGNSTPVPQEGLSISTYVEKLIFAIGRRQIRLEMALARERGIPVRTIQLTCPTPAPIWDFRNCRDLMKVGYDIASEQIAKWNLPPRPEYRQREKYPDRPGYWPTA